MQLTLLITVLISALTLSIIIWKLLFKPLFDLQDKLSVNIRETLAPDIQRAHNVLTTLASAAFVLTFAILRSFGDKIISYEGFLVTAWIGLTITVLIGVAIGIYGYVYRAQYRIMINVFVDVEEKTNNVNAKDKDKMKELINKGNILLNQTKQMQKIMFSMQCAQSITFGVSFVFLSGFAVINI